MREMEESISLVRAHLPATFAGFSNLGLVKDGIYKRMEFAIEDVMDICAILNTDLSLGIPGEDEDIIDHLVEKCVISRLMGEKVRSMKGFRNIVVHRYRAIDDRLAYTLLQNNLGDFPVFIQEIEHFLQANVS